MDNGYCRCSDAILIAEVFRHNFCNLPEEFSDYRGARIVILPAPFDKTSSWMKGSVRGPDAIISASKHLELYDIETRSEVYRAGIHTLKPVSAADPRGVIEEVYKRVGNLLGDGKFVVLIGGEHTVSLGSIMAHVEHHQGLSILHLDAHTDMRDTYEGNRYSHACVMARVREITKDTVSVGIRSMDSSEFPYLDKERIFYASTIKRDKRWVEKAIGKLSDRVYVTIDVDVFDPSIIPSTGTPEPGGLDWYEVMGLLRVLSLKKKVVGFDVVELCPSENKAPDFTIAKLIYAFLSYIFSQG